jgi:hypothetical protein
LKPGNPARGVYDWRKRVPPPARKVEGRLCLSYTAWLDIAEHL